MIAHHQPNSLLVNRLRFGARLGHGPSAGHLGQGKLFLAVVPALDSAYRLTFSHTIDAQDVSRAPLAYTMEIVLGWRHEDAPMPIESRDHVKLDPRYGHYPWWPENGDEWIHPEDVATAREMIPSARIWRRDDTEGPFYKLRYGDVTIRIRPTLWVEVSAEGIEVGDWVEIKSRMRKNLPRIGRVCEMFWDPHSRSIRYQINVNQQVNPTAYRREDLQLVESLAD